MKRSSSTFRRPTTVSPTRTRDVCTILRERKVWKREKRTIVSRASTHSVISLDLEDLEASSETRICRRQFLSHWRSCTTEARSRSRSTVRSSVSTATERAPMIRTTCILVPCARDRASFCSAFSWLPVLCSRSSSRARSAEARERPLTRRVTCVTVGSWCRSRTRSRWTLSAA